MPERQKPRQIIQAALREELEAEDGAPLRIRLLPPITGRELSEVKRDLGVVPDDALDLLAFTTGFDFPPVGTVDFVGRGMSVETFFRSIPILDDGCGNFWIVDVGYKTGDWGAVFFWSHDPAVAVIQAKTLSDFIEQILDICRPGHKNALAAIKERGRRIWANDPDLVPVIEARKSADPVLSRFAGTLPDSYCIADLRKSEYGTGFAWGKSKSDVKRDDGELLFAIDRNKGLLERIFRRH